MDLIKELRELREAIEDALADGKLRPVEVLRILRELYDVVIILLPVLIREENK